MIFYIVSSQQRSGTKLFKSLMNLAGVGNPLEFFLNLSNPNKESHLYIGDLDTMYQKGTLGGVWGSIVHQKDYKNGIKNIKKHLGISDISDFDLLNRVFPDVKFIYLYRINKVKQAISWVKIKSANTEYNRDDISRVLLRITQDDARWMNFFSENKIDPHFLTYESLSENKVDSISSVLDFLKCDFSDMELFKQSILEDSGITKSEYDQVNEEWYQRFLQESYSLNMKQNLHKSK